MTFIALGILIYLMIGISGVISLLGTPYQRNGRAKWSFAQFFRTFTEDRWMWLYCLYIILAWLPILLIARFKK